MNEKAIRIGCNAADVHLTCSYPTCSCKQIPVAIQAALNSLPAEQAWRPIETAPKDRTWVLGFESRIGMNDKYTPHEVMRWVDFGLSDRGAHWRNSMNNLCQPTHWMPLPAAPQAQVAVTAGDAT